MVGWVGGRNLIIKTISAELDCAELGNTTKIKVVTLELTYKPIDVIFSSHSNLG